MGMWLPSRYTASRPSVNRSRLRRSGTRKMFANASKNFMVPFDSRRLLAGRAPITSRRAAGLLDLFQSRFRKVVRLHRDLAGQLPGPEDLQTVADFLDHAQLDQAIGVETCRLRASPAAPD